MTYGVARGMKNFIMITLGTGVGSGIVVDGKIVYGSDGFAGELGHFVIDHSENGRSCGCGRKGCLETYTSATGVARTAREMLEKRSTPSLLREMNPQDITSYDVFKAAEKGDENCLGSIQLHRQNLRYSLCRFHYFQYSRSFRILWWSYQGW